MCIRDSIRALAYQLYENNGVIKRRGRLENFDTINPKSTALLVIDMQNSLLTKYPTKLIDSSDVGLETNKIYCGDTVETMGKINEGTIDLILTSPPYLASIRNDNHKYPGAKDQIISDQVLILFIIFGAQLSITGFLIEILPESILILIDSILVSNKISKISSSIA